MKWWVNECDIVTALDHESVILRECQTQIVWGDTEVFLDITLSYFYFHILSHYCMLSQYCIFIPNCTPIVIRFPKAFDMLSITRQIGVFGRKGEFCPLLDPT